MKIKMELLSDVIFGNGMGVPGAEDISVQHDDKGFPYYKGMTFKGILREAYERYLAWMGKTTAEINETIAGLFGVSGSEVETNQLVFTDFTISDYVKNEILKEDGCDNPDFVLDLLSNVRGFTSISDTGVAKEGSMRMARCVNKGLCFYGEITCEAADESILLEVVESIKFIGSMRNRGFGKVSFTKEVA
ncbi:MAG: RAMP superfamily CRISPR-associated protein [Clostridium sp.]|nr:RAMP superfamily CRISPR-associated protein [Clostridium sp.]MCM1172862.1 RAMP superfamily CRISPR-associated protein [Clostridium sp.]